MKTKGILLFILLSWLALCTDCTHSQRDTGDFQSSGFISPDSFQAVLTYSPDRGKPGLVRQRESSRAGAHKSIRAHVTGKLGEYCIDHNLKINSISIAGHSQIINIDQVRKNLREKLDPYFGHGRIVTEYFLRDNSCVLVYRIRKRGLREEIESIRPVLQINTGK